MLIASKIYTIKDLLLDAGVPEGEELKDISIGGIVFSSLTAKVRIPSNSPVVISIGRNEYKVEIGEEQAQ